MAESKPQKRKMKLWKKILMWFFLVIVSAVALFFLVYVPYFLARVVTVHKYHYHDIDDGKTPATYHVAYQDIEFPAKDGVPLKGWFVPADHPKGTVVFVHGLNRTRVEMLREGMFVHGLGYNALLFDERHAGASGGNLTSLGYYERFDVEGAVAKALSFDPKAHPVIVWGVSMGAGAALMAARETPQVDAVISDSTFLTLRDTTYHHLKLFLHLPKFSTAMTTLWFFELRTHFNVDDFDLRKAVKEIGNRPILFVCGGNDDRMPPYIARELYQLAENDSKMFLEVPGARHGEAFRTHPKMYEAAVTKFFDRVQKFYAGQARP